MKRLAIGLSALLASCLQSPEETRIWKGTLDNRPYSYQETYIDGARDSCRLNEARFSFSSGDTTYWFLDSHDAKALFCPGGHYLESVLVEMPDTTVRLDRKQHPRTLEESDILYWQVREDLEYHIEQSYLGRR